MDGNVAISGFNLIAFAVFILQKNMFVIQIMQISPAKQCAIPSYPTFLSATFVGVSESKSFARFRLSLSQIVVHAVYSVQRAQYSN